MNRKELTETVFKALRSVKEEEEIEDIETVSVNRAEPAGEVVQSGAVQKVQSALVAAIDAAQELGDEKLVTQIGNTITFLTRSQVRGAEAAVDEVKTSKYTSLAEKVIARIKESKKKASLKEDWDDCIKSVEKQGESPEEAAKICGAINRDYVGNYK